jgi:hypothetical protein
MEEILVVNKIIPFLPVNRHHEKMLFVIPVPFCRGLYSGRSTASGGPDE